MLKGSNYNSDVLNCLANLSSDEVFAPAAMANRILDLVRTADHESHFAAFASQR